jgi:hypothetical protein
MSDSLLFQKYIAGNKELDPPDAAAENNSDATDDFGAFGWIRGLRDRAIMLELRKRDGNILAVGYGWLERVEYDPSSCITLFLMDQKIRIKGFNLNAEIRSSVRLFQGIVRHRISWIQEADQPTRLQARAHATVVEAIEW